MTKQDWQVARERTLVARLRDDHGPVRERMDEAADRIEGLEKSLALPSRVDIHRIICGQFGGPSTHDHTACENAANAVRASLTQH